MSLGANQLDDIVIPFEVSVTRSPAYEDALVLAAGPRAMTVWDLCTGAPLGAHTPP
jgi:hypothetical protein